MTNPARELADLLEAWQVRKQEESITSARKPAAGTGLKSLDFWHTINRGIELAVQYEAALQGLELQGRSVAHYRAFLVRIYQFLYAPDHAWSSGQGVGQSANLDADVIHNLRAAGDALEGLGGSVGLTPDRLAQIVDDLRGIRDNIADLPDSPERDKLEWLVTQAIRYGEDIDRYGTEAFVDSANQTFVTLIEVVQEVPPEKTVTLRGFAFNLATNLIAAGLWVLAPDVALASVETLKALGPGAA